MATYAERTEQIRLSGVRALDKAIRRQAEEDYRRRRRGRNSARR